MSDGATRIQIAPSILAADFLHLADAVAAAERAGADRLHLDVMDGRFVPNITLGPATVRAIRQATTLPLEVHLMIVEPERLVPSFIDAGASIIIVHAEVSPHLYRSVQQIQDLGARAGVAINPGTDWTAVRETVALADLILAMTVSPGFGGQEFIPAMIPKIRRLRGEIDSRGLSTELEVDGGISPETAGAAVTAGARVLVAGTSVYGTGGSVEDAVRGLRAAAAALPGGPSV